MSDTSDPHELLDNDALGSIVDASATLLGIVVDPSWRAAIVANLRTLAGATRLLETAALDDVLEPAPVFRA